MAQQKPTVLFLAAWYPTPIHNTHGIFIRNHAIALSKYCHVIVAYAYAVEGQKKNDLTKNTVNPNFEEWLVSYPKNTSPLPFISGISKYLNYKSAYSLLVKELVKSDINVKAIQVNVVFPTALALPIFKKQWPVSHTVLEHWTGYLPEDGNYKGLLMPYFTRKVIAAATVIFYVSDKQKNAMLHHGLQGKYRLIYNVVDTTIFNCNNVSKSQRPLLINVSALDNAQKNIEGILNVIAALVKIKYEFDFLFIGGNAQLKDQYQQRAQALNLENITFTGTKTSTEIADYMRQASAFVLFSNYENMPVVVLESLACGLPVISTNTGCLDTIIKPEFGRLLKIGDEEALLKILKDLLDGKLVFQPAQMNAYINSTASYEVVGKQLYDYYKTLLDS